MKPQESLIETIDLTGQWHYQLDPDDKGSMEQWYKTPCPNNEFKFPGTTNENCVGDRVNIEPVLNKETSRSLRQHYRYVGVAWYEREIQIPPDWEGKIVTLFLERVIFQSSVWIDGREIGMQDSLSTPHIFRMTDFITPGSRHRISIRIDNRDIHHIGSNPSAYTEETQSIWNGIVGRMEIRAVDRIYLHDVQVYADLGRRMVKVKLNTINSTGYLAHIRLTIMASSMNTDVFHKMSPKHYNFIIKGTDETNEFEYPIGDDMQLWDEFSPALYKLNLSIYATSDGCHFKDEKTVIFGMREFKTSGTQFTINGRKTFLRGTHDCCIYPLTGYPPMDSESWLRVFGILKDYGLNHLRFHSWCPPEAAFAAADLLGVYLQIEGPLWMDTWTGCLVGSHPDHYRYLPKEINKIIETYGNHPSFCLFSNGNELNGDFALLHDVIAALKQKDERRVYTLTTNWDRPLDAADDYFAAQTVDGIGVRGQYYLSDMAEGTMFDYTEAISLRNVPIVSHEVGQYSVYPNIAEIGKYTGNLKPVNLESIQNDLFTKSMLESASKFTSGSGMLALQLYRDEIETALRTKGFGGFQLLDLHDFPGQSTATIGILDSFWDSKGLIEPTQFKQFCNPTVLLLRMPKRIYEAGEIFTAQVEIAHFGAAEIIDELLEWSISCPVNGVLFAGTLPSSCIPIGNGICLGSIPEIMLESTIVPSKLTVSLSLKAAGIKNAWNIWVYPTFASTKFIEYEKVVISSCLDTETERLLAAGKCVLMLPSGNELEQSYPGKFFPVFWSPVHFTSEDPCGIYVEREHPVFSQFPTDFYADYQWKDLLDNSTSICLDHLPPDFVPIIQVIPNFFNNRRLGSLLEANVGEGKILICSMDLKNRLQDRTVARQLRQSILAYMAGEQFKPKNKLAIEAVRSLFKANDKREPSNGDIVLAGSNLALGGKADADSESKPDFTASKGNDGIGHSRWCAADEQSGHWWQVDLRSIREIVGIRVTFAEEANYLYVIQVSNDGEKWRLAVNQTGQTRKDRIRVDKFDEKARYVKIVYNGLPKGVYASHANFEVFGK